MIQWQASQYFWKGKQNTGEGVSMGRVCPIEQLAVIPVIFRGKQSFGQTVQIPSTHAFPIPFQTAQDTVLVDGPVFHPQWRPESRPVTTAKSNKWNHDTRCDRHLAANSVPVKKLWLNPDSHFVSQNNYLFSFEIHLPLSEEDRCVGGWMKDSQPCEYITIGLAVTKGEKTLTAKRYLY